MRSRLRTNAGRRSWEIVRFRRLDNGGANLAASDPHASHTYTLDAGIRNAPASVLEGFFNTPYYRSPDDAVAFGTIGRANPRRTRAHTGRKVCQ